MPLARILTRHPEDANAIHQTLVDRGYRVEYADPSALSLDPADLEIDLERLPLDDGLRLASEWAESAGADIYVAPGAVPLPAEPEPPRESERPAEMSSYIPPSFEQTAEPEPAEAPAPPAEVVRETIANVAGLMADSLSETRQAVSQSFSDMKERFAPARDARPPEPSWLERWNGALAERRAARQERKAQQCEAARLAREQRALREARADALARDLREQRARETASRPVMIARKPEARPAAARPVAAASARSLAERRIAVSRREPHADDGAEYWRGAFTGAAVVAVILMIGWAMLGSSRPSAPAATSGHIKQDVPFGPVTLTPSAAPARPAATQSTAPQAPPAHSVTPVPKPAPVPTHRAHRAGTNNDVADDVVVRHYTTTKPAAATNTTAHNSGLKHITDQ